MLRASALLPTLFAKHVLNASLAIPFTYVIRLQRTPEPSRNSEIANQQEATSLPPHQMAAYDGAFYKNSEATHQSAKPTQPNTFAPICNAPRSAYDQSVDNGHL